jgi:multiple sugar transport system ATP-binding protein
MNMVEATLRTSDGGATLSFADLTLGMSREALATRPDLAGYDGKPVIVGIRPEDMEDATIVSDAPADRRLRADVVLREALGADVLVHFTVKAPAVSTEDTKELAGDVGAEALEAVEAAVGRGESTFLARLSPRTGAATGEPIELVVDTGRLHFFDPDSGLGIYGGDGR